MNMQEQLRVAMEAAQASAEENIVQLEKKQTLTDEQKQAHKNSYDTIDVVLSVVLVFLVVIINFDLF